MRDVILVNEQGDEIGTADLMSAHTGDGKLHRAFSALLFSPDKTKMLLQKRVSGKLFGDMWANTCCSHPFPGEDTIAAGKRRIFEELGIKCELTPAGTFTYQARDPQKKDMSENEHDTVLVGTVEENMKLTPDPAEIADIIWVKVSDVMKELEDTPEKYAPWFHHVFERALQYGN